MSAITKLIFDICLQRKGPEDMPASTSMMIVLLVASLAVSVALSTFVHEFHMAASLSIFGVLIVFAFTKIILIKKPERFVQTFSAMLGASCLIDVISIPVLYPLLGEKLNENTAVLFWLIALAAYVWLIVTYGFIVSRAITTTLGYGISIAAAYALFSNLMFEIILAR